MKRGGTLVAGPYAGELGWEACAWVPRVRRLAADFRRTVVVTRESSAALYEFAGELVPIEVAPDTSNCMAGTLAKPPPEIEGDFHMIPTRELVRLEQLGFTAPHLRDPLESGKIWHRYANRGAFFRIADVCMALRPAKRFGGSVDPRRAYPPELADELAARLVEAGLRVASIGGPENQLARRTADLRGLALGTTLRLLGRAQLAIGPSSGPLHLAQLCGCPVVTWYDADSVSVERSRIRYTEVWNPFHAPCTYLPGLPSPAAAAAAALALIAESAGE